VFLSPHLDDAVYSCGGIIQELVNQGITVEVWSIFTADPPQGNLSLFAQSLHARWKETSNPYWIRRDEDKHALESLGGVCRHLYYPDCIYRRDSQTHEPIIKKDEDLFSDSYVVERELIANLVKDLKARLPKNADIVAPLGMGGHIDHRVTRMAAEGLGKPLWFYADYPYAAKEPDQVNAFLPENAIAEVQETSEAGIIGWIKGIACYPSQISSFWSSKDDMEEAVRAYAALPISRTLWHISN
ncbi:PIG-L family deacetylase, partial [bacterium]|nr:PIG-L family deacetylase [bacterium]